MFTLVGQDEKKGGRARLVMVISLALHLVALSALLGAQLWQVPAVQEPLVNTVFLMLGPLPTPPPGGGETAPRSLPPVKQPPAPRAPAPLTQPDPAKAPAAIPPAAETPPTTSSSEPATDPRASAEPTLPSTDGRTGVRGPGPGQGPNTGDAAGPIDDAPLYLNANMVKPQLIQSTAVQPRYTEMARQAHLQGMVLLEAIIDERGNVVNARAQRPLPMGLTEEAIAAVTQWKFKPATLAGRPVKVYFTLRVDFLVR